MEGRREPRGRGKCEVGTDRHSGVITLESGVPCTMVYQVDMPFDKDTHRDRDTQAELHRQDKVRERERERRKKKEIFGKGSRVTLGKGFVSGSRNLGPPTCDQEALVTLNHKWPFSSHSTHPQTPGLNT